PPFPRGTSHVFLPVRRHFWAAVGRIGEAAAAIVLEQRLGGIGPRRRRQTSTPSRSGAVTKRRPAMYCDLPRRQIPWGSTSFPWNLSMYEGAAHVAPSRALGKRNAAHDQIHDGLSGRERSGERGHHVPVVDEQGHTADAAGRLAVEE